MKRVLVSLTVLIIVGCSAAAGIMKGNPTDIAQGVAESSTNVVALSQDLSKCDSLGTADVTFDEERTIGGAVALNWVQQGGGLMVDPSAGTEVQVPDLGVALLTGGQADRQPGRDQTAGRPLARQRVEVWRAR